MRGEAPVQRCHSEFLGCDFWVVTSYEEIRAALANDAAFVSGYGSIPGFGPDNPDPAGQRMLSVSDGPHRQALRATLQGFFSTRSVAKYSDSLVTTFRTKLGKRLGDPTFDFAQEISPTVSIGAICELLELPPEDEPMLSQMTDWVLVSADPSVDPAEASVLASTARANIFTYFRKLSEQRRHAGGADIVTALLGDVDGGPLPLVDVLLNLLSILVAGNETTRLALTGAMVAFAEHPEQLDLLRREAGRRARAVEEILRYTSPGLGVSRTTVQEIELGGVPIPPGDVVSLWLAAGNRDPAVWEDPHAFDITRASHSHVTFGHGPHHCIGAALARVEIAALLTVLPDLVSRIEVSGPLRYTHSNGLTGFARAPMLLSP
jgi:hydroxylation protein CepL